MVIKLAVRVIKCLTTSRVGKINFLRRKIFDYYFTNFSVMYFSNLDEEVNLPDFMIFRQVVQLAKLHTKLDLKKVIKDGRVNKCFASAIK